MSSVGRTAVSACKASWVEAFQDVVVRWGLMPDWRLLEYLPLIPPGPVLDLGVGNGRNALFFAKLGREVDCVDISTHHVKQCKARAEAERLALNARRMDMRAFGIPPRRYALIIASKVLQFLRKTEIEAIAFSITKGLVRRGMFYARMFSLEEFANVRDASAFELVEEHTYYHSKYQFHQHFFTKEEVLALFRSLNTLCCLEGVESDFVHKSPRYQWVIEYVGRRTR